MNDNGTLNEDRFREYLNQFTTYDGIKLFLEGAKKTQVVLGYFSNIKELDIYKNKIYHFLYTIGKITGTTVCSDILINHSYILNDFFVTLASYKDINFPISMLLPEEHYSEDDNEYQRY